jgi:hypothetical protein
MSPVKAIELPPGRTVRLAPGGYHLMLLGLKQQLKAGDYMPITLKVQGADGQVRDIDIKMRVRELASGGAGPSHR